MTWVLTTNKENFFLSYLQIINGIAKLSKDEMAILASIMEKQDDVEEFDFLQIRNTLGVTEKKFKTTLNSLIKKGLLVENEDGEYTINERINVARGPIQISFELRIV